MLGGTALAAVRRDENLGDRQPHPCFCLTTVGLLVRDRWHWRRGYSGRRPTGDDVTDVGGNLLGILTECGDRSGARCCARTGSISTRCGSAIYGDVVYHHGAGFRPPARPPRGPPGPRGGAVGAGRARTPEWVPVLGRAERSARYRIAQRRHRHDLAQHADDGQRLSDEVFGWILEDDEFFRRFQQPAGERERGRDVIVLLLVTQNEAELLRWNLQPPSRVGRRPHRGRGQQQLGRHARRRS